MQGDVQLSDLSEDENGTRSIELSQENGCESVEKKTQNCKMGKQWEEAVLQHPRMEVRVNSWNPVTSCGDSCAGIRFGKDNDTQNKWCDVLQANNCCIARLTMNQQTQVLQKVCQLELMKQDTLFLMD